MMETIWRPSLDLALHRNRQLLPQSLFVQLATVRADGRPAVRTIVFRGFLDRADDLTFVTDGRAAKVRDLQCSSWVEACWYFPRTREQFRFGGTVQVIRDEKDAAPELIVARLAAWRELSDESRLTFTWPPSGSPRDLLVPFPTLPPDPDVPLPEFSLLVLSPQEVDHLELDGNPQNRVIYTRDSQGRWSGREVNP